MIIKQSYAVQTVLELACAAQRYNGGYIKEMELLFASNDKIVAQKHPNKTHILYTLGAYDWPPGADPANRPALLRPTEEDTNLANEIRKFYKRLLFAAVSGENEFKTTVNALLESTDMPLNQVGFIACLPSVYARDLGQNKIKKITATADQGYIAEIGASLFDKDCEVLLCQRSKNFDAWNIDAIIDNKVVSWMSKTELTTGPAVVVKAKVKDHSLHWKHNTPVTRLNYVKVAQ